MSSDCGICQHREHKGVCGWPIVTTESFALPGRPTVLMSRENVDRWCNCGIVDALMAEWVGKR